MQRRECRRAEIQKAKPGKLAFVDCALGLFSSAAPVPQRGIKNATCQISHSCNFAFLLILHF
jgi:hypothetical protein